MNQHLQQNLNSGYILYCTHMYNFQLKILKRLKDLLRPLVFQGCIDSLQVELDYIHTG